jgi:hypothetical protein
VFVLRRLWRVMKELSFPLRLTDIGRWWPFLRNLEFRQYENSFNIYYTTQLTDTNNSKVIGWSPQVINVWLHLWKSASENVNYL